MSQETRKKIYLVYGTALTVLILTVAVMLTAACLRIYESGPSPFTRESIARELRSLRLPALLLLDMLVAGILLAVVLPLEEKRPRAIRENYTILARLQKRTGSITNRTEQKKRTAVKAISSAVIVLLYVYPTVYLLTPSNFGLETLSEDIKRTALLVFAATALAFAVATIASHLLSLSLKREIEETKALLIMQEQSPVERADTAPTKAPLPTRVKAFLRAHEKPLVLISRLAVLAAAVVFLVLGVLNGGIGDVLAKAARICTECIGLG